MLYFPYSVSPNRHEPQHNWMTDMKTVHYFLMRLLDEDEKPEPDLQEGEVYENLWLSTDEARRRLTHDESKGLLEKALVIRAVDSV